MKRYWRKLLALCLVACTAFGYADVTPALRAQIEQQAANMALAMSPVREELRLTGFLDDRKVAAIALKSPPAHALAWAAIQAEEAKPGAAVALLEHVALGLASRHVDAIRYEPQLSAVFKGYRSGPIPPPPLRTFAFDRAASDSAVSLNRLPARAEAMLQPLAKYALAYPQGVQGLLVHALKLQPTEAMQLEKSARSVEELIPQAIRRAAPPPEKRFSEVLHALVAHGGVAIQHEEVLALFPQARVGPEGQLHTTRWIDEAPLGASALAEQKRREERIAGLVSSAFAAPGTPPDPAAPGPQGNGGGPSGSRGSSGTGDTGSGGPGSASGEGGSSGAAGGGGGGARAPSFEQRVANLHGSGTAGGAPASRAFNMMRSIGGGRGGGGIVLGAPVSAATVGKPLAAQWEQVLNRGQPYAVLKIALTGGAIVYAMPVRGDIALAATRLTFGDKQQKIAPTRPGEGNVLVSLLTRGLLLEKKEAASFLVHPAIADLDLGRELVTCDGAAFLMQDAFAARIQKARGGTASSGAVPVREWFDKVTRGSYGGWYRYVDRPARITRYGAALRVRAAGGARPDVLFEFAIPDDDSTPENPITPETHVVNGLTEATPEFRSLNDFIATFATLRWLQANHVAVNGEIKNVIKRNVVRTVLVRDQSVTFSSRDLAQFLADDVKKRKSVWKKTVSTKHYQVPPGLLDATIKEKQQGIDEAELRNLGYDERLITAVLARDKTETRPLERFIGSLESDPRSMPWWNDYLASWWH